MLEALSLERDDRIGGFCVTARADYGWFLKVTEGSEANLSIQRQIIKSTQAYATLRSDLKRGCILPPLVLAARNVEMPESLGKREDPMSSEVQTLALRELQATLARLNPDDVQIIDGLQRTNAIRQ